MIALLAALTGALVMQGQPLASVQTASTIRTLSGSVAPRHYPSQLVAQAPKPALPRAAFAFFSLLGAGCAVAIGKTVQAYGLIPFRFGNLEWLQAWLLTTVADYCELQI